VGALGDGGGVGVLGDGGGDGAFGDGVGVGGLGAVSVVNCVGSSEILLDEEEKSPPLLDLLRFMEPVSSFSLAVSE
jgi:hypothetical protein